MNWIKTHKTLCALILVLLTMVPSVPKYEIVDAGGRGIGYYEKWICGDLGGLADACQFALKEDFADLQWAWSDKQPLIPGLFRKQKVYRYRFDRQRFRERLTRNVAALQAIEKSLEKAYPVVK